jgi:hypothetical protein
MKAKELKNVKKKNGIRYEANGKKRRIHLYWRPNNLIAEPPNTVRSCSRHGVVAAWLTSERPGSVYLFRKHLLCCQHIHSFSHCGRVWNGYNTVGGKCALVRLFAACEHN